MNINNKTKTIGLEILGLTLISILSFSVGDIYISSKELKISALIPKSDSLRENRFMIPGKKPLLL